MNKPDRKVNAIVIGSSTGGLKALEDIFLHVGDQFPPILLVQHISPGFLETMVNLLKEKTKKNILIAKDGDCLEKGKIYVAPDGFHMGVKKSKLIFISGDESENGAKPSISYLFRTALDVYGKNLIGILLTGMGHDGVVELKRMKDFGAITIVQDKESSVVHGMAGDAILKKAVTYVFTPAQIASWIKFLE